jgi:hypothetical protein
MTLVITNVIFSQNFSNQPSVLSKRYVANEIIDLDYGIMMYNKLVPMMGGDSVRYTKEGVKAQNYQEDYYVSGKLLHKGFYADGAIKVFKNYYENGQLERSFSSTDVKRGKLEIFYEDGKVKSSVNYYQGNPQNQYDFFKNGTPEYIEENDKKILRAQQIPLKVAYAISIHKSQGCSLDYAEIDLAGVFEYGQAYVALSRVKSLEGLSIIDVDYDCIEAHPKATTYYDSLS